MSYVLRTVFTGVLAILPVLATVAIIGWAASFVSQWLSRDSWFGRGLAQLGGNFVHDETLALLIGGAIVIALLYFLGLLVQTRLERAWRAILDGTIGRVPLIGTIYKTIARFVRLLDRKEDAEVHSMSPVWCYFSDERRTCVLGLMPTSDPLWIDGEEYRVVMIPTAPVPFGGGLFFLPEAWVRPAPFGVEGLTNIYVSMGVTAPDYLKPGPAPGLDDRPVLIKRGVAPLGTPAGPEGSAEAPPAAGV